MECLQPSVKHGEGSVILASGVRDLVKILSIEECHQISI